MFRASKSQFEFELDFDFEASAPSLIVKLVEASVAQFIDIEMSISVSADPVFEE
jgi:hypothetical protein